jgi:hypothetical protein
LRGKKDYAGTPTLAFARRCAVGHRNSMPKIFGFGYMECTLVSDRHTSIAKYMRTQMKDIIHYFDIWHLKKSKYPIYVIYHLSQKRK